MIDSSLYTKIRFKNQLKEIVISGCEDLVHKTWELVFSVLPGHNCGHAHASSDTHRDHAVSFVLPFQLRHQRGHHAGT